MRPGDRGGKGSGAVCDQVTAALRSVSDQVTATLRSVCDQMTAALRSVAVCVNR